MNKINLSKQRQSKNRVLTVTSLTILASSLILPFQQAFAGTLTTLVTFNGTNGATPRAGVLQGSDKNLYGTTSAGGSLNNGTAFKLTGSTFTTLTTLINFTGTGGINKGTNPVARLFEFSTPNGDLYGATFTGGTSNFGTIFKLKPTAYTTLTTLVNFTGTGGINPGANPAGRLIKGSDGNLWGTASTGGTSNKGTIFKVSRTTNALNTVVNFNGTNGANPLARLQLGSDGNYYGTASAGGANNKGVAFKLTPAGILTPYSFNGTNGQRPRSGLIESSGFLYGTTYLGGANSKGAIFKVPLGGGTPVLVASFNGTNGANPTAALIKASNGNFYGTASTGGANNKGTIYQWSGATITSLFSFNGTNGSTPESTLIQLSNGALYGTTSAGGTSTTSKGTVFKFVI
ncbi:choice-of-anchor tandem repeat GloVer-containing protein [Nostoc sp. UHCC 0302]|uniref:choice-of-anchor tandem repeat GloVer-containing protein n=1 Tax=Nostoc sp. UHCC 0302 TaxID=3134896 RepID=UPI00311CBBA7